MRRVVAAVLASVLVVTGGVTVAGQIVAWVSPSAEPAVPVTTPDRAFDGVALSFAVDYLSWDESDRDSRQTAMSRSAAAETTVDGWRGAGRQWADSPSAVGIVRASDDRAVVTVRVRVTPFAETDTATTGTPTESPPDASATQSPEPSSASPSSEPNEDQDGVPDAVPNVASGPVPGGTGWTPGQPRWLNLAVPVARQGGRVVVTASPALMGSPQTAADRPAVPRASSTEDSVFARDTREVITTLVRAYGTGDLGYARAAGTSFTGLVNAATVQDVTAWRVQEVGDGADGTVRLGDVTVSWELSGGAGTVTCTYRVELRKDGGRWFLASIGVATEAVA